MVRIDRSTLAQVARLLHQAALVLGPEGRILWREDPDGILAGARASSRVTELLGANLPEALEQRLEAALLGEATEPMPVRVRDAAAPGTTPVPRGAELVLQLGAAAPSPSGPRCLALIRRALHDTSAGATAEMRRDPEHLAALEVPPGQGARPLDDTLLDLMPEGVLALTPEGRIRTANLQAASQFGYRADEFVGRQLVDLLAPAQRRPLLGAILRPDMQPEGGLLLSIRRADGTLATAEFRSQTYVDDVGRHGSIATLRDVSRTGRARQLARLRHVEEATATFSRGLAAELRAAVEAGAPPGTLRAAVLDLVERLTTVGGHAAGEQPPRETLSLNTVVANGLRDSETSLGPSVSLRVAYDPEIPPMRGTPEALQAVVAQLCRNAAEAMPMGGHLHVRTDAVAVDDDLLPQVAGARRGRFCQLTVQDDGVGIDPSIRDRIFEPYFSTSGHERRSGLGLAMVRAVVHGHGGFMSLESQPGRGTRLRVFFPAAESEAGWISCPRPARKRRGETLLLVDDGVGVRRSLQPLLNAQGYRVLVAGHGAEARRLLRRHGPQIDVAVLDLAEGSGRCKALVDGLRAIKPDLATVVISAARGTTATEACAASEGVHIVSSTGGQTSVTDSLRSILDGLAGAR